MSFKSQQEQVDVWAQQFAVPYWQPLEMMARLTEETGELAREINHRFGPKKKKSTESAAEMGDEIADIMFTLICIANAQDIDLDEAFDRCMEKVGVRDANRFEKK
ncbi:MAG: nucleotide pyrophosphohydrolase [bacterium]